MKKNLKWFTFLELIISMTIMSLLIMSTYIPYSVQAKKWDIKLRTKEIVQSVVRWWEYARNWIDMEMWWTSENASVWVYLHENTVDILAFSFRGESEDKNSYYSRINIPSAISVIDSINLDKVEIKDICYSWNCINSWLILFESIYWDTSIHEVDWAWNITEIIDDSITIRIDFENSTSGPLEREITFDKETRLLDY